MNSNELSERPFPDISNNIVSPVNGGIFTYTSNDVIVLQMIVSIATKYGFDMTLEQRNGSGPIPS